MADAPEPESPGIRGILPQAITIYPCTTFHIPVSNVRARLASVGSIRVDIIHRHQGSASLLGASIKLLIRTKIVDPMGRLVREHYALPLLGCAGMPMIGAGSLQVEKRWALDVLVAERINGAIFAWGGRAIATGDDDGH